MWKLLTVLGELLGFLLDLRRTPAEDREKRLARVRSAIKRADEVDPKTGAPKDDVTDVEDRFNGA